MIHMLFQALSGAFTDSPGQPFFFFVYSESVAVPFLAEADGLHCEWGQDQYRFAGIRPGSPANTPDVYKRQPLSQQYMTHGK